MTEINQEINSLVQADIDGVISPEEREKLQEYLDSMPEVREFHADCERLVQALDGLEAIEPPPGLDDAILALQEERVRRGEPLVDEEPSGGLRGLFAFWFNYPVLRYATAFLVGALLTSSLSRPVGDNTNMGVAGLVGTMTPVPEFALVDARSLENGDLELRYELLEAENLLQLRFRLDSDAPVQVQVRYVSDSYDLFGFSQQSGELAGLSAGEGEITLRMNGENGFAVFLTRVSGGARDMELRLSRGGEMIETVRISP